MRVPVGDLAQADLGQTADFVQLAAEQLGARHGVQPLGQDGAGDRVQRGLAAVRRRPGSAEQSTTGSTSAIGRCRAETMT